MNLEHIGYGFLMGCFFTLLLITLILLVVTRSYFINRVKWKESFQLMIARIYHKDQIPIAARILGLSNLISSAATNLSQLLELLSRPNHHLYASSAKDELENITEYNRLCKQEAKALQDKIFKIVKEFEHLQ